MQIRTKLTFYYISVTASLLCISFCLVYYVSLKERENYFFNRLKNKAQVSADLYFKVRDIDKSLVKIIKPDKNELLGFVNFSIFNSKNVLIYSFSSSKRKQNLINKRFENFSKRIDDEGLSSATYDKYEYLGYITQYDRKQYKIVAIGKDDYGISSLSHLKRNLIIIYFIILLILALTGRYFSRNVLKPISDIMNQVDSISFQNLRLRLKEDATKKDEISRLISTFNKMLDRVEKTFKLQRAFVSNVSHELMNPLSSITSQIEVMLLSKRNEEEYIKTLEHVLIDLTKLNSISKQLIDLSRYNESQDRKNFSKHRIDDLVWDVRSEYLKNNPYNQVEFHVLNLPENDNILYVNCNETLLKTCFLNLIDNGCKFSNDQKIDIHLLIVVDKMSLIFENKGKQIDPEDLKRIFVPFFRSDKTASVKGYGIGLSIVKSIIELHSFDINVTSNNDGYTSFTINF